jgi:hypothetical protein
MVNPIFVVLFSLAQVVAATAAPKPYITSIQKSNPAGATGSGSVGQPLRCVGQLPRRPFGISGGRVQVFVPKNLGQANEIVVIVRKILMRHRMPKQMGVHVDTADGTVLINDGSNAAIPKRAALADKDTIRGNRGPGFQIGLQGTTGWASAEPVAEMRPLGDTIWRRSSRFFPPAHSGRPPMRDAAGANYLWITGKVGPPVPRV